MKNIQSLTRLALLTLALGTASVTGAFAQTTSTTPTTAATMLPAPGTPDTSKKGEKHLAKILTPAELAQYQKDQAAVLAANPDLKTEADNLKAQHEALKSQGASASADAKAALKAAHKDYEEKMQIAMLKLDPSVAPILAKLNAAHKEGKHATANA